MSKILATGGTPVSRPAAIETVEEILWRNIEQALRNRGELKILDEYDGNICKGQIEINGKDYSYSYMELHLASDKTRTYKAHVLYNIKDFIGLYAPVYDYSGKNQLILYKNGDTAFDIPFDPKHPIVKHLDDILRIFIDSYETKQKQLLQKEEDFIAKQELLLQKQKLFLVDIANNPF